MSEKDPLEELMRSRLLDDKPAESGWNVPPDSIFDNAMDAVNKEKNKRRRPFFIILALIALLAALGILVYVMNQRINTLKTDVQDLKEQSYADEPNSGSTAPTESLIKTGDVSTNKESNEFNAESKDLNNSSKNINIEDKPYTINNKQIKSDNQASSSSNQIFNENNQGKINEDVPKELNSEIISFQKPPTGTSTSESNEGFTQAVSDQITQVSKRVHELKELKKHLGIDNDDISLALLKKVGDGIIIEKIDIGSSTPEIAKLLESSTDAPFSIIAYAGGNLSSMKMKNTDKMEFSPNDYDKYYVGYQAGLNTTYQLNKKIQLLGDLGYTVITNKSTYDCDFKYDKNNEYVNQDGEIQYSTDMSFVSPVHSMNEEINFKILSTIPENDDLMKAGSKYTNVLHFINLKLGLDYLIIPDRKIDLSAGVGLRSQLLLGMKEDMDLQITHDSDMMLEKTVSHKSTDQMNKLIFSPYGSVDLGYNLDDKNSIKLSSGYYVPLNSLRKTESPEDPSTYLNNFEFSLNFQHRIF